MDVNSIYLQTISDLLKNCKLNLQNSHKNENPDKLLMKSQGMVSQELKCVVALDGDSIYDADIKLVRSNRHIYKTSIKEQFGERYRLQQIQDCYNLITMACDSIGRRQEVYREDICEAGCDLLWTYQFVTDLFYYLRDAREMLTNPRRKSIEEHISDAKRKCFRPQLPQDVAVSIFLRESRLILAVYLLECSSTGTTTATSNIVNTSSSSASSSGITVQTHSSPKNHATANNITNISRPRYELTGRITVDCEIPWICQVLRDISEAIDISLHLLDKLRPF